MFFFFQTQNKKRTLERTVKPGKKFDKNATSAYDEFFAAILFTL